MDPHEWLWVVLEQAMEYDPWRDYVHRWLLELFRIRDEVHEMLDGYPDIPIILGGERKSQTQRVRDKHRRQDEHGGRTALRKSNETRQTRMVIDERASMYS